jgi:hypothetical protein
MRVLREYFFSAIESVGRYHSSAAFSWPTGPESLLMTYPGTVGQFVQAEIVTSLKRH